MPCSRLPKDTRHGSIRRIILPRPRAACCRANLLCANLATFISIRRQWIRVLLAHSAQASTLCRICRHRRSHSTKHSRSLHHLTTFRSGRPARERYSASRARTGHRRGTNCTRRWSGGRTLRSAGFYAASGRSATFDERFGDFAGTPPARPLSPFSGQPMRYLPLSVFGVPDAPNVSLNDWLAGLARALPRQ